MERKKVNNISCVVPVYNEGKRIENVLKVLQNHPLIDELIVINDGSTDNSEKVIKKFKNIKFVSYKKNKGKAYAVMRGIKASHNDFLMFIDADLIGLNKKNISDLIKPVKNKEADVSISLRKNAPIHFRLIGIDFISGERVIPKEVFKKPEELLKIPGWGLESYMNSIIIKNKYRIKIVLWKNVESPYPQSKYGFFSGSKIFFKMMSQIFNTIGFFGCFKQIIIMNLRKV